MGQTSQKHVGCCSYFSRPAGSLELIRVSNAVQTQDTAFLIITFQGPLWGDLEQRTSLQVYLLIRLSHIAYSDELQAGELIAMRISVWIQHLWL